MSGTPAKEKTAVENISEYEFLYPQWLSATRQLLSMYCPLRSARITFEAFGVFFFHTQPRIPSPPNPRLGFRTKLSGRALQSKFSSSSKFFTLARRFGTGSSAFLRIFLLKSLSSANRFARRKIIRTDKLKIAGVHSQNICGCF